jgi:hypothetical protein|nr:MAG TPA: hypothetical protein [Caudoviricetes sp.]
MKNQTLSIEQMLHLKELGVDTSKASMVLIATGDDSCPLDWETALEAISTHLYEVSFELFDADSSYYDHSYREDCGVFTLQDIINMLPENVPCKYARYPLGKACLELGKDYAGYSYTDMNDEHDYEVCFGGHEDILVEVYNLLCWCAENGYLNNNQTK